MATGASMSGGDAMRQRLARIRTQFPNAVAEALFQEAQIELTEVKRRTPVDKGTLRASEHIIGPIIRGKSIYVLIAAGGPAAPYAIYVHENLDAFHKVGQAKYIESVILESRPYMAARVAKRMQLNHVA